MRNAALRKSDDHLINHYGTVLLTEVQYLKMLMKRFSQSNHLKYQDVANSLRIPEGLACKALYCLCNRGG
jgi:hypothetical protein